MKIVRLPEERGVGLIFFASVTEAMQAALTLADLQPAAMEHIDRPLFEQTRGQREFQAARDLLELDAKPCEAILLVEFFEDAKDKLALMVLAPTGPAPADFEDRRRKPTWSGICARPGLSLLTSRKGAAKPACFIEDTAVRPGDLPAYVAGLQELMARRACRLPFTGMPPRACCMCARCWICTARADLQKFRQIANEVSALVAQFKGSLAGEHGVGIARTRVHEGAGGAGAVRRHARDQAFLRPGQSFQPRQNHRRRPLSKLTGICAWARTCV